MVKRFLAKKIGILKKLGLKKSSFKSMTEDGYIGKSILKGKKKIATIKAADTEDFRYILDLEVSKNHRNKGLGHKLTESMIQGTKKTVVGNVISRNQIKTRLKWDSTRATFKNHKMTQLRTNKGKKVYNTNSGKVKFIRRGGRIIPIKVKK